MAIVRIDVKIQCMVWNVVENHRVVIQHPLLYGDRVSLIVVTQLHALCGDTASSTMWWHSFHDCRLAYVPPLWDDTASWLLTTVLCVAVIVPLSYHIRSHSPAALRCVRWRLVRGDARGTGGHLWLGVIRRDWIVRRIWLRGVWLRCMIESCTGGRNAPAGAGLRWEHRGAAVPRVLLLRSLALN